MLLATCEHIVSSVSLSGDRIVPPSIIINCGVFHYCFERIAPPYAAMASGLVSTTAFVVNLPMLRPGAILHEPLVVDGLPVDTPLDVSTWFEEVTRLTHRDLPEFVPITSTATEELTEHTRMRVNHRVYIINDVAMPSQFGFPFVIHWNYSYGGMALRALVVAKDIQLPVLRYQPRFSLQDYLGHLVPCEVGLVICTALLLACPHSGSGLVRAGHSNNRLMQRHWTTFRRHITSCQEVID